MKTGFRKNSQNEPEKNALKQGSKRNIKLFSENVKSIDKNIVFSALPFRLLLFY
jgi:hypothetical protein